MVRYNPKEKMEIEIEGYTHIESYEASELYNNGGGSVEFCETYLVDSEMCESKNGEYVKLSDALRTIEHWKKRAKNLQCKLSK